ncbi:hypothetical protein ACFFRR_005516 [Megaselia abdita]
MMDINQKLSVVKGDAKYVQHRQLHRIMEDNTAKYSKNESIIFDDNNISYKISYNELNEEANKIANLIIQKKREYHLEPNFDGDYIVAVCIAPSDKLIKILLAIWKAGASYCPIDVSFPQERINHMFQESRPILFIVENNDIKNMMHSNILTLTFTEIINQIVNNNSTNILVQDMIINSDLAIVQYTSGSTGIPKGVRLTHSMICNRIFWQWNLFPYKDEEKVNIFKTSLTFVDSISEIWSPLLSGRTILIIPKESVQNPEKFVCLLEKYKIVRLVLVPTLLRTILMFLEMNTHKKYLGNLRYWICSGESLPIKLAMHFYNYFDEKENTLLNFYGSTEVMGDVTYFQCKSNMEDKETVPIGYPIQNTIIYLLDKKFRPVENGSVGEIFVAGLNLANGYVNNRDSNKFLKNPYATSKEYDKLFRTGDFGKYEDGQIYFSGRVDSQIKIRGHRVDLSEIEKAFYNFPQVEKTIVLCFRQGEIDQAVLAFVKFNDAESMTPQEISNRLEVHLQSYMIPQIILIDSIPLLVNGKVDRQHLLNNYSLNNNNNEQSFKVEYDFTGVPDHYKEACRVLFDVITCSIGIPSFKYLSLKSNFYEIGGNSLNSIYTITLLREKGFYINISDFIKAKNMGDILYKLSQNNNVLISFEESWKASCPHLDMKSFPLKHNDKGIIKKIITDSFYGKAELEMLLKPDIHRQDYCDVIDDIWEVLVDKGLSFLVKDMNSQEIIGTSLNFDARDEPEVEIKSKLSVIFDFLEHVEGHIRDNQLPEGINKIFHAFMMGTSENLSGPENIACIHFMEYEVLNLATEKQFAGILTTNTSPLTKQMGSEIFNYKTMLEYPISSYVHRDGTRPFGKADKNDTVIVAWKDIHHQK